MNILICDDIKAETKKLTELLNDSGFDISATAFHSGHEALDYVRSGVAVDICFLDVVMPEMDGIELARKLRAEGFKGKIVFLTTSKEYALDAFGVKAFSYLLKPTTHQSVRELLHDIEAARGQNDNDTAGITVNTKNSTRLILFRDISYAEVINHKVFFRLANGGEADMYAAFAEIAPQLLSDTRFAQCHNSFIVNMNAITEVTAKEIVMRNKARIPISRSFSDIKNKYLQWITMGDEK